MKLAIIHLSDIHLSSNRDWIVSRAKHFVAASKSVINECQKVIVVISGDIANTGQVKEYQAASNFLQNIEAGLKMENAELGNFEYIMVPGNHDCDLPDNADPIRNTIVDSIKNKDEIQEQKFIDLFLSVQKNYWDFYAQMTGNRSTPFVSKSHIIRIDDDFTLEFHLYNSSMLSMRKEVVGNLLIPENHFLKKKENNGNVYVFSVFHHNTGWFSSSTPNNNKKRFEANLLQESNVIMCGHEHDSSVRIMSELDGKNTTIYLEGSAFQQGFESSYNILEIDTVSSEITWHKYKYKNYTEFPQNSRYEETVEKTIGLGKKRGGFTLLQTYEDELLRFNIPIKVKNKTDLTLNDIYVFPDLDPILDNIDTFGQYIDSYELGNKNFEGNTIILEGESQSGKSCLLSMLYLTKKRQGKYPLYSKRSRYTQRTSWYNYRTSLQSTI